MTFAPRPLDEICEVTIGRQRSPKHATGSHLIPYMRAANVKDGNLHLESILEMNFSPSEQRTYGLLEGDVLVTEGCGSPAEIGASAIWQNEIDGIVGFQNTLLRLRSIPGKSDPWFLLAIARWAHRSGVWRTTASGTSILHIGLNRARPLRIPAPDIEIQRRVGDVLHSFDELIENNRRRIEILEETARSLYREWFVRYRFPGHENVPLVDSPLGPIPHGWRAGCVGELVTLCKTTIDPATLDPSTPAVGLEHIPRRQLTLDAWGEAGDLGSRKTEFAAGDILFGKIRPYFHKVSVAPLDGICSTDAIVLRPHAEHWGQAVLSIASDEFVANAVQTSNGTRMPRADWKVIREFPLVIPPSELADRFSETAHRLLGLAQVLMFQARDLASFRDLLLPKLVTGQIEVGSLGVDDVFGWAEMAEASASG